MSAGFHRDWRRFRAAGIPCSFLAFEGAAYLFLFRFAVILEQPGPIRSPMQGNAYGPSLRENLRILNGGFVLNCVAAGHTVSLDHMKRLTMKVPRHVEPRFVIVIDDVHHQCVALPMAS